MILKVYSDETIGVEKGSALETAIVVGGYIGLKPEWSKLAERWQSVLDSYRIKHFHFREFNAKTDDSTNPYKGWDWQQRDDYFHDLAMAISESQIIPIGGAYNIKLHRAASMTSDPYEIVVRMFFDDLQEALKEHWPDFIGGDFENKAVCIHDDTRDKKWRVPMAEVHQKLKTRDSRFGELSFENDEDPRHTGLQAADYYCAISRQNFEQLFDSNRLQDFRIIDIITSRRLRPKDHPWSLSNMDEFAFRLMIQELRRDCRKQKAEWKERGDGKRIYYPLQHYPNVSEIVKAYSGK